MHKAFSGSGGHASPEKFEIWDRQIAENASVKLTINPPITALFCIISLISYTILFLGGEGEVRAHPVHPLAYGPGPGCSKAG